MPLRYGSETAEHQAVRTAAGLFDLSHMGEIGVSGPGAAAALDYALVGELSALRPGRARYTMICAADGGVLDDLIVYRLADGEFLVVANAANTGVVRQALRERAAAMTRRSPTGPASMPDRHPGPGRRGDPRPAHRRRPWTRSRYYASHRAAVGRP